MFCIAVSYLFIQHSSAGQLEAGEQWISALISFSIIPSLSEETDIQPQLNLSSPDHKRHH